jgi:hypothetical protein
MDFFSFVLLRSFVWAHASLAVPGSASDPFPLIRPRSSTRKGPSPMERAWFDCSVAGASRSSKLTDPDAAPASPIPSMPPKRRELHKGIATPRSTLLSSSRNQTKRHVPLSRSNSGLRKQPLSRWLWQVINLGGIVVKHLLHHVRAKCLDMPIGYLAW